MQHYVLYYNSRRARVKLIYIKLLFLNFIINTFSIKFETKRQRVN